MTDNGKSVGDQIAGNLGLGLGIMFGVSVALMAHVLWTLSAGPMEEWLTERRKGEKPSDASIPRPDGLADLPSQLGDVYRVLISDLHIDTWQHLEQRRSDLKSFLKALRLVAEPEQQDGKPSVQGHRVELYVNGDLLDVPLHPAHSEGQSEPLELHFNASLDQDWEGVFPHQGGNSWVDELLMALRHVVRDDDPNVRIFYLTGNHDIGISGLRYFRPKARREVSVGGDQVLDLPAHAIWNPTFIIETGIDKKPRWVCIEHGHLHDPLLWLYMRYAVFDLLRGGTSRREHRLMRRIQREKIGQDRSAGETMNARPDHPEVADGLGNKIVRLRFRHAARRTLRRLHRQGKPVRTLIFGHTHMPERHAMKIGSFWDPRKDVQCEYINAGSWAGNKKDQLYWVITPEGNVTGPHQWQSGPNTNQTA